VKVLRRAAPAGEHGGERVLLDLTPSAWSILTERWIVLLVIVGAGVIGGPRVWPWAVATAAVVIAVRAARVVSRRQVLTRRRLIVRAGVVRRVEIDVPLEHVQQLAVVQRGVERLVGIGTVMVETAGSGVGVSGIIGVRRPERVAAIVRAAMESGRRGRARRGEAGVGERPKNASGVLVLGIAGGIGAGKSAVAASFARLGCVVVDSDKESRAALDRPEVRSKLAEWWGDGVLGADGAVDRRRVAEVVFKEPAERARLEALVHPLVRQSRAEMVRRAAAAGVGVVIVDAPLLFEAGVDRECDAVVFVDAPDAVRLERVRQTRGWTREELARRELAQLGLDEKRRRCRYVVENAGSAADLDVAVEAVLERARRDFGLDR
jgi:dephospho-CoA kinase